MQRGRSPVKSLILLWTIAGWPLLALGFGAWSYHAAYSGWTLRGDLWWAPGNNSVINGADMTARVLTQTLTGAMLGATTVWGVGMLLLLAVLFATRD